MSIAFSHRLQLACTELDISLTDEQQASLLRYIEQLAKWNKTYNLTALRDPEQMLIQHLFDSLSIVKPLDVHARKKGLESLSIVDVGSGAGLPGVVLATACSTWNVSCIDAVEKKIAFIRQMANVLGLGNLYALHNRVEDIPPMQADVVTSRAFSSLLDFVHLSSKHIKPGGSLLAMKGKHPHDEIADLEAHSRWRVTAIESLTVPELDAQRCLLWLSEKE